MKVKFFKSLIFLLLFIIGQIHTIAHAKNTDLAISRNYLIKTPVINNQNSKFANKYIEIAKELTIKYKLSELPLRCLFFDVLSKKFDGQIQIDIREKHNKQCGGDPTTSPRLYSIKIEEKSGTIWSDAKSLTGQMEKIGKIEKF
jgi:hypothetical protein